MNYRILLGILAVVFGAATCVGFYDGFRAGFHAKSRPCIGGTRAERPIR